MRTFTDYTKDTLHFKARDDLIIRYFDGMEKYIKENNIETFRITYMKLKYGGLRVEWYGGDDMLFEMCCNLENDSEKTCWICGAKGEIRYDFFRYETLCFKHFMLRKLRGLGNKIKRFLHI